MKYNLLQLFMMMGMLLTISSCQNEDNLLELEDPLTLKPDLLEGTWTTTKVEQFDQEAINNGFPEEVQHIDITSIFPFEEFELQFTLDEEGRPDSFVITTGNSPNLLGITSGKWVLDDYVFAREISLYNSAELSDASLRIEILEETGIILHIVRLDANDGTEYSYYQFQLQKK